MKVLANVDPSKAIVFCSDSSEFSEREYTGFFEVLTARNGGLF